MRDALRGVVDPELGDNIVELKMVDKVELKPGGVVLVRVALTTPSCPLRGQIKAEVTGRVGALPGVSLSGRRNERDGPRTEGRLDGARPLEGSASRRPGPPSHRERGCSRSPRARAASASRRSPSTSPPAWLPRASPSAFSTPTSRVSLCLACSGCSGQLEAAPDPDDPGRKLIQPLVQPIGEGELRVVSMGFLSGEDEAVMWRGLMLNRAVQHFLEEVAWGDIDYLVVDMPPGTGDIQMGLARMLPSAEVLVVTTPAHAAQKVAARAASMARKSYLRVIGVVENMSAFNCAHGERYEVFGRGGGQRLADEIGAPLLGSIPLEPAVALWRGPAVSQPPWTRRRRRGRRSPNWWTPCSNAARCPR